MRKQTRPDDTVHELLNRCVKLQEELNDIVNALRGLDTYYIDLQYEDLREAMRGLMRSTLKLNFTTYPGVIRELTDFMRGCIDELSYQTIEFKRTDMTGYLEGNMQNIYKEAVKEYKQDAKNEEWLKANIKCIPKSCPWTLDDIIRLQSKRFYKVEKLAIEYLPRPIDDNAYLQISDATCDYIERINSSVIPHGCKNCDRYMICHSKVYGGPSMTKEKEAEITERLEGMQDQLKAIKERMDKDE